MKRLLAICFAMCMIFCGKLYAADGYEENPLVHYVGVNFGTCTIFNHYTSARVGLTYELKKFEGRNGIGFDFEYMFGPGTEIFVSFPISFHNAFKVKNLILSAAPGLGINQSLNYLKSEDPNVPEEERFLEKQTRQNLLIKGTVAYDYPIRNEQGRVFMDIMPYFDLFFIADYNTYCSLGAKVRFHIYK